MSLAVAIQMDPLETVDIDGDSTFVLALEAQRRGHGLYHYGPRELAYKHGRIVARAQRRFVRLGEDDYLVLSNALRRRLDGLRGLTDGGRFHPLAAPAIADLIDGMEQQTNRSWKDLLERLQAMRELEPELPSTLQAELRDYLVEGFRWLARLAHWGAGACLADDMGLGKTVQVLALFQLLTEAHDGLRFLVVSPTSPPDTSVRMTVRRDHRQPTAGSRTANGF